MLPDHLLSRSLLCNVELGSSALERQTRNQGSPSLLPFRSLGIFVLSMTPQFTQLYKYADGYMVNKCSQIIGILNRLKQILPQSITIMLYNALLITTHQLLSGDMGIPIQTDKHITEKSYTTNYCK